MEVDGTAFKKAREQIRKEHINDDVPYGKPAIGTQLWLADEAGVTPRTIQNLENKGVASLGVIDAVSIPLRIQGKEFIKNYGKDSVNCEAQGVIDYRPNVDMLFYPDKYHSRQFLITIDPLKISFANEDLSQVNLKKIEAKLFLDDLVVDFYWVYNVQLIPGEDREWLGVESEVSGITLKSLENYKSSIMFKQDGYNCKIIRWSEFVDRIRSSSSNQIKVQVILNFEHFKKDFFILSSIKEIIYYMDMAKIKYSEFFENKNYTYPRFFQPKALVLSS